MAADIGAAFTKVLLIDRVDGEFRLIARASSPSTLDDAELGAGRGLLASIDRLQRVTSRPLLQGRRILTPEDRQGRGVDAVAVATSAAPLLRTTIVGLAEDVSVSAATQATRSTYTDVHSAVSVDGGLQAGTDVRWSGLEPQGMLRASGAEVILITGGRDGGAVEPLLAIAGGIAQAPADADRVVLFAGNADARDGVARILAGRAELVFVDNVAPRPGVMDPEPAARELQRIYRERNLPRLPGYAVVRGLAGGHLESSADGLWASVRYLAQRGGSSVLGVDLGSAVSLWGFATGGELESTVRTRFGAGIGAMGVLAANGAGAVLHWLAADGSERDAVAFAERWEANPADSAAESAAAVWRQAFVRAALGGLAAPAAADILLGAGGALTRMAPAEAAMALLDGLQPKGICRLVLDSAGLCGVISALGRVQPQAAAELLDGDGLAHLGVAVCAVGRPRFGQTVLRVRARLNDQILVDEDVPYGTIRRIPAPVSGTLRVEVRPSRGVDVGLGPGAHVALELEAAGLGVILDCRGRPLELPEAPADRMAKLREWAEALR